MTTGVPANMEAKNPARNKQHLCKEDAGEAIKIHERRKSGSEKTVPTGIKLDSAQDGASSAEKINAKNVKAGQAEAASKKKARKLASVLLELESNFWNLLKRGKIEEGLQKSKSEI